MIKEKRKKEAHKRYVIVKGRSWMMLSLGKKGRRKLLKGM
jgi:hypothetical protein